MQAQTRSAELDDATLAFAEHVFHAARIGDSVRLGHLLGQGMPADLRNHAGDSLLMLASYHGRLAATSVLLDHGADAQLANRRGHTPLAGAAFKGDLPMVRLLVERRHRCRKPLRRRQDRTDDGRHVQSHRDRRVAGGAGRRPACDRCRRHHASGGGAHDGCERGSGAAAAHRRRSSLMRRQPRPMGANAALVCSASTAGASSTSSPRRPALT